MNETNEVQIYKNFLICNKLNLQKMFSDADFNNAKNLSIY